MDKQMVDGSKRKPNILWIVLDHVTFRHYKMTKSAKPILNTYERLASDGMEFTQCKSVHPLCLPARTSMLTGMYANHHGHINNGKHDGPKYPLFNEYFEKLGYKMGYFGKNHSGYEELDKYGFEGFFPLRYGNPYRSDEYKEYLKKNKLQNPIYHQEWGIEAGGRTWENKNYDLTETDNFNTYTSGYLETSGPVHEVDFILSMANEWLDKRVEQDEAFIMRVDTWGPHHAFQVPFDFKDTINQDEIDEYPSFNAGMENKAQFSKDFLDRIQKRNPLKTWQEWQPVMKRAYENYSYIDAALGKFIDKLEHYGIADNTIIIYTADHGDSLGSHGGMVDKAGDMMEEVMHIPMVVRWPGVTDGSSCDALVSNLDITPTILEMAGIKAPEYMDGKSLTGLLKGDDSGWREDFMAQHYGHFKIHVPQRALYYKNFKFIATKGDIQELYDLEKDQFELHNLIYEPWVKDISSEMRKRLLDNMDRYEDSNEDVKELRASISQEL